MCFSTSSVFVRVAQQAFSYSWCVLNSYAVYVLHLWHKVYILFIFAIYRVRCLVWLCTICHSIVRCATELSCKSVHNTILARNVAVSRLGKKLAVFYGVRRFITIFLSLTNYNISTLNPEVYLNNVKNSDTTSTETGCIFFAVGMEFCLSIMRRTSASKG
jgi:hypothetical protein